MFYNIHRKLNKFLYSAVNGLPDYTSLDEKSSKVLYDTHQMLMEQVEHDATPEFLEELKLKICGGQNENFHPKTSNVSKIFQDTSLNPLNFPFEYLLNGTLPADEADDSLSDHSELTQETEPVIIFESDKSNVVIKQ